MNLSKFIEGGTYLKAGDLQGREAAVTIRAVDIAEFDDAEKVVLHFEGKTRALACNTTNTRTIAEVFGPQSEDWIGRIISIYPARVNFHEGQLGGRYQGQDTTATAPPLTPRCASYSCTTTATATAAGASRGSIRFLG